MASATHLRRIQKDINECIENGIDITVNEDNTSYTCIILGPSESDYEGGIFKLKIISFDHELSILLHKSLIALKFKCSIIKTW